MKRNILLVAALCLSLLSYAQKAPKKSFLTEIAPLDMPWIDGEQINFSDADEGEHFGHTIKIQCNSFILGDCKYCIV